MNSSPTRLQAPEPQTWIPIDLLESLPDLEELLNENNLVDSGQTRAVRADEFGRPTVLSRADLLPQIDDEINIEISREADRHHSYRKRKSEIRSLKLHRKVKIQRAMFGFLVLSVITIATLTWGKTSFGSEDSKKVQPRNLVSTVINPISVPVVIEGKRSQIFTTATNLKSFIVDNELQDYVSIDNNFSRNEFSTRRSIRALEFRKLKSVTVIVDGVSIPIDTTSLTVDEALRAKNISFDADDLVTPAIGTQLTSDITINIVRITSTNRTEDGIVPFQTINQNDSSIYVGQSKVIQAGQNGSETISYIQTLQDGNVVNESVASRVITKSPVSKIVAIGTKKKTVSQKSASSIGSTQTGKATFYSHIPGTCAHKTLPMGTIVTVTNLANGKSTTCRVADRGPYGEGRIIDLEKGVFSNIASLSTGIINVKISH